MTRLSADARIQSLLLWLRAQRIVCTEITVGDVSLAINDVQLAMSLTGPPPTGASADTSDEEGRRNLYEQYGGKAIDEVAEQTTVIEDDDD